MFALYESRMLKMFQATYFTTLYFVFRTFITSRLGFFTFFFFTLILFDLGQSDSLGSSTVLV